MVNDVDNSGMVFFAACTSEMNHRLQVRVDEPPKRFGILSEAPNELIFAQ